MALVFSVLQKIYSQVGKKPKFASKVPPNQQRALRFIAANKSAAAISLALPAILFLSLATVMLGRQAGLQGIALAFLALCVVFVVIPGSKSSPIAKKLAFAAAPATRVYMEKLLPLSEKSQPIIKRFYQAEADSGVYTRGDLIDFIKRQEHAANNSINKEELAALITRMEFEEKTAKDIMKPRKQIKIVGASEAIGPVLINELHETGQQYFLIKEEFNDEIIGTLDLMKLVGLKQTGNIKDAMDSKLFYLNEKNTLYEANDAFFKTGSDVFVVVDQDEEITGLISINQIITELTGRHASGDFENYDNREAVAEMEHGAERG